MSRASTFAAVLSGLLVAHQVADHIVQTDHQDGTKGAPGREGRVACAKHVATYTATTAGTVAVLNRTLGLGIHPGALLAGQAISAATHYIADRRTPIARLAAISPIAGFYQLGAPRPGRDDNPTLGTGAYAIDQAWHASWLGVAALVTALGVTR